MDTVKVRDESRGDAIYYAAAGKSGLICRSVNGGRCRSRSAGNDAMQASASPWHARGDFSSPPPAPLPRSQTPPGRTCWMSVTYKSRRGGERPGGGGRFRQRPFGLLGSPCGNILERDKSPFGPQTRLVCPTAAGRPGFSALGHLPNQRNPCCFNDL